MRILVLGIGNLLMTDDALGSRVVEALQRRYASLGPVAVVDGGTLGLDLLPRLEGVEKLLIIDALEMNALPGTVFRLHGEEAPRVLAGRVSVHQAGVADLLAVAELQGLLPPELVVWGAQPESIDVGLEMTPAVTAAMEDVLAGVVGELATWGVALQPAG